MHRPIRIHRIGPSLASSLVLLLTVSCRSPAPPTESGEPAAVSPVVEPLASPETVHVLFLIDGPAWQAGLAVGEQDLADHFAYVRRTHEAGLLVANGTITEADPGVRGMYVLAVGSHAEVDDFVANDPGIRNGVLEVEPGSIEAWTLRLDGLGAPETAPSLYVVDIETSPDEARVEALAGQGVVLTGGALEGTPRHRYVLRAASIEDAARYARELGGAKVREWRMATRSSVAEARRRRRASPGAAHD